MHALFLIFCLVFSHAYGSSPRLIITLGSQCDFTHRALANEIDAIVVSGTPEQMKEQVHFLEKNSPIHLIVLSNRFTSIKAFAKSIGYAYIHLNDKRDRAFKLLKNTISALPVTDASLPRTNPIYVGQFYYLMMKVNAIFKKNNIRYWATCGTVLGILRHRGMIPWDDDIDIAIFHEDIPRLLSLKNKLADEGLAISYHPKFQFYKIYFTNGDNIISNRGDVVYEWKYPFIDIFPLKEDKGRITYCDAIWKPVFENYDYYKPEDLNFPLQEMPFGPTYLPVAAHPRDYLDRMYGDDWNEVAYMLFDHKHEEFLPKIKVDLTDRSQPAYILPSIPRGFVMQ